MTKVAVVGVGPMAPLLADALRADGHEVVVPGQCELLLTYCPTGVQLRQLVFDDDLIADASTGTTWAELTSATPQLAKDLVARAEARGLAFVDAPLGGAPDNLEQREVSFYVGGSDAVVAPLRGVLAAFTDPARIQHCGPVGSGYVTKLIVNLLWFTQAMASAECLLVGARSGIAPTKLLGVLRTSIAGGRYLDEYAPRLLDGDYLTAFRLERYVEQLQSIETHADALGAPFVACRAVVDLYRAALGKYGPVDGELLPVANLEELAGEVSRTTSVRSM